MQEPKVGEHIRIYWPADGPPSVGTIRVVDVKGNLLVAYQRPEGPGEVAIKRQRVCLDAQGWYSHIDNV